MAELQGDVSLYSKYQLIKPDALIRYVYLKFSGLDADTMYPPNCALTTRRESAIVFVAKSMKTMRVISKEPATLMWFQKGIDRAVREYLAQHWYLSKHIDLRDQAKQGQMAIKASSGREFATVDLSAASDSVSWDLVKKLFAGTPLLPFLVALRSTSTRLPSGKVVRVAKFAPMGSALCFPIETLVFACIIEHTLRYVHDGSYETQEDFRVYGDDLIVPDSCLAELVVNLRRCGFRINDSKTFAGSNRFRESCGVHAYDGVDVTPMRISRKYCGLGISSSSPTAFAGIQDMANEAYRRGFLLLRRYLVDKLINGSLLVPLFSEDGRNGLISPVADNYRLTSRFNRRWQRRELKAAVVHASYTQPEDFADAHEFPCVSIAPGFALEAGPSALGPDQVRYFEWQRRAYLRSFGFVESEDIYGHPVLVPLTDPFDPDFRIDVQVGRVQTSVKRRWVVDPA